MLAKDDTVVQTKVTVGRQTEADTVVATAVSSRRPQVVTTGFTRLTDGAKVAVSTAAADAAAPAAAGPARPGQRTRPPTRPLPRRTPPDLRRRPTGTSARMRRRPAGPRAATRRRTEAAGHQAFAGAGTADADPPRRDVSPT